MKKKILSIDEYISKFSLEVQAIMQKIRALIRQTVPEATEKISWGMPTFVYYGNLVHFAGHKNHIGFYPGSSGIEKFQDQLNNYHYSKGAVQFPYTKPIPYELIQRMTEFRAYEK